MNLCPNLCACCDGKATHRGPDGVSRCDIHRLGMEESLLIELAAERNRADLLQSRCDCADVEAAQLSVEIDKVMAERDQLAACLADAEEELRSLRAATQGGAQ